MVVRELLTRLSFKVDNAKLKAYERSTSNIKSKADDAANSFRGMFAAFIGFQGLKSLAQTADDMQNLKSRIGLLPQAIGSSADAVDMLTARANAARQPLLEYGQLYTRIGSATKDYLTTQDEVLLVTDAVSKGLIVAGASGQESASVMMQLSQAFGSGRLNGAEFVAMAEGAPKMLRMLADAMGMPQEQLKELSAKGEITTKKLIEAFQKIAPEINRQFKSMPQTIGQTTTIMHNRWMKFIGQLSDDSGAVKAISDAMTKGWDKADNALRGLVKSLGGATQAVKFFGIALAAIAAPLAFMLLVGFVTTLISPVGMLVGGLFLLGLALEDLNAYMNDGLSISKNVVHWFKEHNLAAGVLAATLAILTGKILLFGTVAAAMFLKVQIAATWAFLSAAAGATILGAPLWAIIVAIAAIVLAIKWWWTNWEAIFGYMQLAASVAWASISDGFYTMVNRLKGYWDGFKSFFGVGLSSTISPSVAAGAAASSGGVGGVGGGQQTSNITINQTLPPGTTAETAAAAKNATAQAAKGESGEKFARMAAQGF